nr:endolytic transglycosylase MltG [Paenibacillus hamazuiensis]
MTRIALLGLFVLLGAAAGIYGYTVKALKPMPASVEVVQLDIAPGTGPAEVAKQLEKSGLIRNASVFTYYLKWKKQGSKFQAGRYAMSPGITVDEIIEKLNKGQIVKEEMLRLTVPEGYTIRQIAEKIGQQFGTDAAAFMGKADEPRTLAAKAAQAIPDNPAIRHRLEGYLFPETYEWKKDVTVDEMIDRMLSELDVKLGELPADWPEASKAKEFGFHQIMTVASLVEREVALDEERPIVAGIIYNRLTKNMNLQIDATVQYLFDKPKERLFEKDLQIESPYNTYLHPGLPPGPIASPSLSSIKAALYPAETKFLFYVTKKDGSKGHLFAETYEEHQKNIAASQKMSEK